MPDPRAKISAVDVPIKALDPEDPAGSFEAILSAPTVDRDREIVDPKAFDPLPDHIAIDTDHGMSVSTTVASGTPFYDGELLKIRGTFSTIPRAQEVRTLVGEGHVRHMSVAFMAAKYADPDEHDDGWPHITKAELLNAAITPVPANTDAVITAAKSVLARAGLKGASDTVDGAPPEQDPEGASAAAAAVSDEEAAAAAADETPPAHEGADTTDDETPGKAVAAALREAALLEADELLVDA